MKKILIALLMFAGLGFVAPSQTFACSYMYQEPQEWYSTSDFVFIGEITNLKDDGDLNGMREVTFEVLKQYKGNFGATGSKITLTTGANSAMCGYDKGSLSEGDIWSIYTGSADSFNSSPGNTKYTSFAEARVEVDVFAKADDESPIICTMQYDPVCGEYETGIRCVTTPCPSTARKTYGNACQLGAEKAKFLYTGECKTDWTQDKPVPTYTPPISPTGSGEQIDESDKEDGQDGDGNADANGVDGENETEENPSVGFWSQIWNFFKNLF